MVKEEDLKKNDLVNSLFKAAREMSETLIAFKRDVLAEILHFNEELSEKYGIKYGGRKGNISLVSFDGLTRITLAVAEPISFNEKLQLAKQVIDECLTEWSSDSRPEVRAVIEGAFQTDKQGGINTARILGLRKLAIEDEKWQKAMRLIGESMETVTTKEYVRFHSRPSVSDSWVAVPLQ
jgi:hypothetical protein